MRLFLDAHISGPRIARALRERSHGVRAAEVERELDGLGDEQLLEISVGLTLFISRPHSLLQTPNSRIYPA